MRRAPTCAARASSGPLRERPGRNGRRARPLGRSTGAAAAAARSRRISGPTRHPRAATPQPTAAERRVLRLIDHPWLDRLIRGRIWIGLVAVALLGIVAVQVALLRIGAQIGSETATVNQLIAGNQMTQAAIGNLEAGGGVLAQASTTGMVDPLPGQDTYLRPSSRDVRLALDRMHTPTVAAVAAAQTVHDVAPPPASTTNSQTTGATGATAITGATGASSAATGSTTTTGSTATAGSTAAAGSTSSVGATRRPGRPAPSARPARRRPRPRRRTQPRRRPPRARAAGWSRRAGERMTLALSHRRIGVLLLLFGLLLTLGLARALQLTTVDSAHLSSLAEAEHAATIVVPAARGNIVDRNGTILATTEPASDVSATPALVHDQGAFAAELAPILGVSPGLIEEKLAHPTSGPGYTLIARHVPAAIVAQVKALKLPGVAFAADPRRVYPDGALAAQVLGGVSLSGSSRSAASSSRRTRRSPERPASSTPCSTRTAPRSPPMGPLP